MSDLILSEDGGVMLGEDGGYIGEETLLDEEVPEAIDLVTPFFANNPYCVEAIYTPKTGTPAHIQVIYDAPFSLASASGIQYQSATPSCMCMTSNIPNAIDEDAISIAGVKYYIKEVHPDGTGITTLILSKDPIS